MDVAPTILIQQGPGDDPGAPTRVEVRRLGWPTRLALLVVGLAVLALATVVLIPALIVGALLAAALVVVVWVRSLLARTGPSAEGRQNVRVIRRAE